MAEEIAVAEETVAEAPEPAYELVPEPVPDASDTMPPPPPTHTHEPTKRRGRPKGSKHNEKPAEELVYEEPATPDPPREVTRMTTPRAPRVDTPDPINSHSIANAMLDILANRDTYRRDQKRALYKSFLE